MDTDQHNSTYIRGRGAQINPSSRFSLYEREKVPAEDEMEAELPAPHTKIHYDYAKGIVNRVRRPDAQGPLFFINPYQGCEHGCTYCYARKTHEYWGFNAGLDFETQLVVKPKAPQLLAAHFEKKSWQPQPIGLSGNTDCYQPAEKKFGITRELLNVFATYKNPVSILTKNTLIKRDIDLLKKLAKDGLVRVLLTLNTLDESLRRLMEPRTATHRKKLEVMMMLRKEGIPVGVMMAPIIPGLNEHEIPAILQEAARHGALDAYRTVLYLEPAVFPVFANWIRTCYPHKAHKVLNRLRAMQGGNYAHKDFKKRLRGTGEWAATIHQLFNIHWRKHFATRGFEPYNLKAFVNKHRKQTTFNW